MRSGNIFPPLKERWYMSKIERALRKAEEEKRRKAPIASAPKEPPKDLLATEGGITEAHEAQAGLACLSEYFRKISAKLKACCDSIGATDVVFASAGSGEGKTTNAVNCAISLCQDFNLSVCLVDCDLRNPRISDYFKSNGSSTIIEHLKGEAEIDSVIGTTPIRGLSVVNSKRVGRLSLPLLNTDRLRKLVRELRSRFDFVIFDSSPILPVADAAVLSKHVSATVLVIESGRTRRKQIEQIFEQIDRDKVIGFIMNYKNCRMPETYNYARDYDYGFGKK